MLALNQQQLVFVPIPNLLFRPETKAELEIPTFRPFFPAIEHDFLNEFVGVVAENSKKIQICTLRLFFLWKAQKDTDEILFMPWPDTNCHLFKWFTTQTNKHQTNKHQTNNDTTIVPVACC